MSDSQGPAVKIDGTLYSLAELSEEAQRQLSSIRYVDEEIGRLRRQLAIAQTARAAYARALQSNLPGRAATGGDNG